LIRAAGSLAWRAFLRFLDHHGPDRAAAVAYYTLLSLLPLFILLISIGRPLLGSFDAAYRGTIFFFRGVVIHLDEGALESLRSFVERATHFQWPGLILLAWTARRSFSSLFSALTSVFEVPGPGPFKENLLALGMVLVTGIGLLLTLALTMMVAAAEGFLLRYAGPSETGLFRSLTAAFVTLLLPFLITLAFFFIMYRVVSREVATTTHALVGALLATTLWECAKAGFAYYVRNFAHYGNVYGAFEAVIVLALWLELSVSIVLYSGAIVSLLADHPVGGS